VYDLDPHRAPGSAEPVEKPPRTVADDHLTCTDGQ